MLTFTRALLLYISLNIYVNIIYGSLYSPQLSTAKQMNFATSKKIALFIYHAHLLFPRQGLAASCMMRLMSEIVYEDIDFFVMTLSRSLLSAHLGLLLCGV